MTSLFCAIGVNWDYANARNSSSLLQSQCQQCRITAVSSGQCLKSFLTVMGRKNDLVNSIYCSNVWVLTASIPLAGALVGNTRGERATFAFCWAFPCRECHKYFCCPWDMSTAADTQCGFQFSLCGLGQQLLGITPASIEGTVVLLTERFCTKSAGIIIFFQKSWGTLISAPFSLPFKMLYLSINSRHAWTLLQSGGWKNTVDALAKPDCCPGLWKL